MRLQEDISGLLDVRRFELRPGDTVLLYTDGITEARNGESMLDNQGLRNVFEGLAAKQAQEILDGSCLTFPATAWSTTSLQSS